MSDRELDAQIAVEVFGWEWLETDWIKPDQTPLKALFAPADDPDWKRFNHYPPHWRPAKEETQRAVDWDQGCGRFDDRKYSYEYGIPRFSDRLKAAMEIVMLDRWRFSLTHEDTKYFCEFRAPYWTSYSYVGLASAETLELAICHAALDIVRKMK